MPTDKIKLSDLSISDLLMLYKFLLNLDGKIFYTTQFQHRKIQQVGAEIRKRIDTEIDFELD